MYCPNCGAELTVMTNFCPYCGSSLQTATTSVSLLNKAAAAACETDKYNLVLISRGTCDAVQAGDLLEDVFGYTDAESGNLVSMAPVVVGENLTLEEATTVAQLYTEYGMQVSITDENEKYVDLSSKATRSVFDSSGSLLAGVAAVIGAITVANRIKSYRTYKRPSLLERIFHLGYKPEPPEYRRNFRRKIEMREDARRRTIRKPEHPVQHGAPAPRQSGMRNVGKPAEKHGSTGRQQGNPGNAGKPQGNPGGHGGNTPGGNTSGGHGGNHGGPRR